MHKASERKSAAFQVNSKFQKVARGGCGAVVWRPHGHGGGGRRVTAHRTKGQLQITQAGARQSMSRCTPGRFAPRRARTPSGTRIRPGAQQRFYNAPIAMAALDARWFVELMKTITRSHTRDNETTRRLVFYSPLHRCRKATKLLILVTQERSRSFISINIDISLNEIYSIKDILQSLIKLYIKFINLQKIRYNFFFLKRRLSP